MDRDTCIIAVYCVVVAPYQALAAAHPVRQGGCSPTLRDEAVIPMDICGEYFKWSADKAIWEYFRTHSRHFFPALRDRPLLVRHAANLGQITAAIPQRLAHVSGQATDPLPPLDPLPFPVCGDTRRGRDRCCKPSADSGDCAAKQMDSSGCTLGGRISRLGMMTPCPLWAARPQDLNHLEAGVEDFIGVVPADKGCMEADNQALGAERQAITVVTPPRARMHSAYPRAVLKACGRGRTLLETIGSHVTEHFAVARTRAHDFWHDQHRLIRQILAHTVVVFLTLRMGRPPLDLDGLVNAGTQQGVTH